MSARRQWEQDAVLQGFQATTIPLQSKGDGELVATLVRRQLPGTSPRAVLYVHGFVDYFFQSHVAEAFNSHGWDFYAIDLHRYGRSIRPGNHPNFCASLAEYDDELTQAIDIICEEDDHDKLLLMGHSTGGLISTLYAQRGVRREMLDGLILNSPFFDFFVPAHRRLLLPIASGLGHVFPHLTDKQAISPRYLESLSVNYQGEWTIEERWKPHQGFPAYYGWISAIRRGHARIARGIDIGCPVLVLHSSQSMFPAQAGDERHFTHDIVLDIAQIRALSHKLGKKVQIRRIEDGMHDLFLSREPARTRALEEVFKWITTTVGERQVALREFRT